MKARIYIAAPIVGAGEGLLESLREAFLTAHELLDLGYAPFCPHLAAHLHLLRPRDREDWLAWGIEWVRACHGLLRLPGESEGVEAEVQEAHAAAIPVFETLDQVELYFRTVSEIPHHRTTTPPRR